MLSKLNRLDSQVLFSDTSIIDTNIKIDALAIEKQEYFNTLLNCPLCGNKIEQGALCLE